MGATLYERMLSAPENEGQFALRVQERSVYREKEVPRKFHNGVDLHARGDEALAMMEGTVLKVGQDRISGKYVVLRHGEFTVSYCHLSRILVSKGETVRPRDAVGITGSTGRSTGEHLHLTCRRNGQNVDPAEIFGYIKATREKCVAALAEMSQGV